MIIYFDPNYVFTTDNFIKLILMMGETICGKTSLIRIISKLKGNNMEILNIRAGMSNKYIINYVNEKKLTKDDNDNDII